MNYKYTFKSRTSGLWVRFISKMIGTWLLIWFLAFIVGVFVISNTQSPYAFIAIVVAALGTITWITIKDFPWKWNNTIAIDLESKTLTILSQSYDTANQSIIDYEGARMRFEDIDHYLVKNYESIIFSSYYLVSISVNGKNTNLIAFKDPVEYSEFIKLLEHGAGLTTK